jgi:hypothetical protein
MLSKLKEMSEMLKKMSEIVLKMKDEEHRKQEEKMKNIVLTVRVPSENGPVSLVFKNHEPIKSGISDASTSASEE